MSTNIDSLNLRSLPVPIDAGKFQQGLRERFIERDGMFFTNEQVQKYDKKKKENPELELTRLQSKTPLTEFKRFIGKLKLTISDLSMQEAFSDLVIEREQIMRIREITIQATIDKKRGLCGPLSLTPLGCMVVGELLIPLGYLGVREFMSAMTMME